MDFKEEMDALVSALRQTAFPKITRRKVLLEMMANGVAGICSIIVYHVLQKIFVVKSIKNLWGIAAKKDKFMISKTIFEYASGVLVFIIALFVFTYVEAVVEKYLQERNVLKK